MNTEISQRERERLSLGSGQSCKDQGAQDGHLYATSRRRIMESQRKSTLLHDSFTWDGKKSETISNQNNGVQILPFLLLL